MQHFSNSRTKQRISASLDVNGEEPQH